ncbi:MAG: NBR1-Ig-like domain-containing protein, partial [Candidatus Paceibacterota bacterium]
MINFKKLGLTLAALPLLFVVSVAFSSMTGNVEQAEAADCRAIMTFDGKEIGNKNDSETFFRYDGLLSDKSFDVKFSWKTDANVFVTTNAEVRVPVDASVDYPSDDFISGELRADYSNNKINSDGDIIWPLNRDRSGVYQDVSIEITRLTRGDKIQLYSRAGGNKCRVTARIVGNDVLVDYLEISPEEEGEYSSSYTDWVYQGETYEFEAGYLWGVPAKFKIGAGVGVKSIHGLKDYNWSSLPGRSGSTSRTIRYTIPDDAGRYSVGFVTVIEGKDKGKYYTPYASKGRQIIVLSPEKDRGPAILNVESYLNGNKTPGVTISQISGSPSGMGGLTHYKRIIDNNKIDTAKLRAEKTFSGSDFSQWEGCSDTSNNGIDCLISVDQGDEKTIRAYYEEVPENLDSAFISQNVPKQVEPGETFEVSIRMRNTGDISWTQSERFRLGSQNPRDNNTWGVTREVVSRTINPNKDNTFNFDVTAPSSPGTYNFQWRMVQERVAWFGDLTNNVRIKVQSEEQVNFCDENPNHSDCIDDPEPPQSSATLNVNSSNTSSGVSITGTGNLNSGNTPYSINKTTNLSGSLIAKPTASNGNVFKNWSGCDSPSGTSCRVSVSTGNSKTVTAIYEQPNNPPVVNAGQDHWVLINREYSHSGAFATDQDDNLASYQWSWDSCKDYDNNSFTCPQLTGTSGSISGGDANISGP